MAASSSNVSPGSVTSAVTAADGATPSAATAIRGRVAVPTANQCSANPLSIQSTIEPPSTRRSGRLSVCEPSEISCTTLPSDQPRKRIAAPAGAWR